MTPWKYEILSAIPLWEIEAYFKKQCLDEPFHHQYIHDQWKVILYVLDPKIQGCLSLPQTRIEFTGDRTVCSMLIKDYRKVFMRGGA